jgi:5-bromo-4-chloroindolyl phosphate hydrolysis protein
MARGARMVATVPALLRLADRYEALAKQRKQEEEANQSVGT